MTEDRYPSERWTNMRRMAWVAVIAAVIGFPVAFMIAPELEALAVPFYSLCGSIIVVGYMGVSGAADAWGSWK